MKFTIIKREPDDDLGVEAKIKRWGRERSEQSVFQSKSLMSDGDYLCRPRGSNCNLI